MRVFLSLVAALSIGSIACDSAFAQSAKKQQRAELGAKFEKRLPACQSKAKKENVGFADYQKFIRECVRG